MPSNHRQSRKSQKSGESLPPGVELLHRLKAGSGFLWDLAFSPDGSMLATASDSHGLQLWDPSKGKPTRHLGVKECYSVAFSPGDGSLASGDDPALRRDRATLWDPNTGLILHSLGEHDNWVIGLAFNPSGSLLACSDFDGRVDVWDPRTGQFLNQFGGLMIPWSVALDDRGVLAAASHGNPIKIFDARSGEVRNELPGHAMGTFAVAFEPSGKLLVSGGGDTTIKIWDVDTGSLIRSIEGHTDGVTNVAFSSDGRLLASKSDDQTVRLWDYQTFETLAVIPAPIGAKSWKTSGLAFHPNRPALAAGFQNGNSQEVRIWALDLPALLGSGADEPRPARAVHHATAKIVLVGDHSVGKSGLAYRLIHGAFKEQASTHGQQFWVYPDLGHRRADGTDCEAILWDLAGQPDYRLVHALFVDNADLALVLFDGSDLHDPLHGVSFWLKQLEAERSRCPIILVAAQADRGTSSLTFDELESFCRREGIAGPIVTSALTGEGVSSLIECMRELIGWDHKAATVTTSTFKRIKDYVLGLKEAGSDYRIIVTPEELRVSLKRTDPQWQFSDTEMLTAVGHLENYGYVKRLQTSNGSQRILLQPELLNNLASSFVLEARRHPKGLGALEERRLLADGYDFPELRNLSKADREVMLDSAALLFLEHHVCFRETDPLRMEPYLVFPELINLKKPPEDDPASEDGVAYSITGPTENVFASLVVLLGYTHTFTRTAQWHDNARYEIGEGLVCAFRQEIGRDGELELVLSYGPTVGAPVRALFQGLFESFLGRRNVTVTRYEPVRCTNAECNQLLERSVVRQRIKEGKNFAFCNDCGEKLILPTMAEPIQLTREVKAEVELQRRTAEQRTRFEQAVFRLLAYTAENEIPPPETFISYAWGVGEHERWVEKRLAPDLQKAGIDVVLDRWHNMRIGSSMARFIERIDRVQRIIMVGTPLYRHKYDNKDTRTGHIVAAEIDLINNRLLGTEQQKESVLPVLLEGEKNEALPPLVQGRIHADFRNELDYFDIVFELILSHYELQSDDPLVTDLRESLKEPELR